MHEWQVLLGWGQHLEGDIQAVNRAELAAFVSATKATTGSGSIGIDNDEVVQGFWAGRFASPDHGDNQDLWHELALAMRNREGVLCPVKVKGVHLGDADDQAKLLRGEILDRDYFGNISADRLAGAIADSVQIQESEASCIVGTAKLAAKVHKRLGAAALQHIKAYDQQSKDDRATQLCRPQREQPSAEHRLNRLIAASGHHFSLSTSNGATCRRCWTHMPMRDLYGWLAQEQSNTCKPKEGKRDDGVLKLAPGQTLLVGRIRTDPTHHLAVYPHRGLTAICCLNCGAYASLTLRTTLKYLKLPCKNAGGAGSSRSGAEVLRQLERRRNLRTGKQGEALLRSATNSRRTADLSEHLKSRAQAKKKRKIGTDDTVQVNSAHTNGSEVALPAQQVSQPIALRLQEDALTVPIIPCF